MKTLTVTGALALLAMIVPAAAGPNGTHWEGSLTIHSVKGPCTDSPGFSFKSGLRPGGLQNNSSTHTYFSLSWSRGAASFELPKRQAKGKYVVNGVSTKGHPFRQEGATAQFVGFRTTPKAISNKTSHINVQITLKNMWGIVGCTTVLKGSYTADPFN